MHTNAKVLIVDDIPATHRATRQLLAANNFAVINAENGQEALGLLQAETPDLALINMTLPDMDGFEICRRIKAHPELEDVFVVIVLEEQAGADIRLHGQEAGVQDYIVRPITNRALLSRLGAMLAQRSAEIGVREKEELLRQRLAEMAAFNVIGQQVNLALPMNEILPRAVDEIFNVVKPDQAFIFMVEEDRLVLRANRSSGELDDEWQKPIHRLGECMCGQAIQHGRSLYSKDIRQDPRCTWNECKRAGLRSLVALPLKSGGETFGVLGLASKTERDFEQQSYFFETLASQLSLGMQNARLFESISTELRERKRLDKALEEKNKVLAAMQATMLELISERDLQSLLESIVKRAGDLLGTDSGAIDLVEPGSQRLKPKVGLGVLTDSLNHECVAGEGVTGLVWQTGMPLVVDDYDAWSGRKKELKVGNIGAVAGVPLLAGGRVIGSLVMCFARPSTRIFGSEELGLLVQFARLASIALENARLFTSLQQELAERERAEKALSASEEHFRTAFHTSPDAININRLSDGVYVDINEGFSAITGYSREEVVGRSSLEINIWNNPEDRARLVTSLRRDGVVNNLEAQFRMKDGKLVTALMSARVIMIDGIAHILSITRDIEEKKRFENALKDSEYKFRRVVEATPIAMNFYELDDQDRLILVDANPASRMIIGNSQGELIGKPLEEAFPSMIGTEYPEKYKMIARGELGTLTYEIEYGDNNFSGYFEVHAYRLAPGSVLVDFVDISERKRNELELKEREFWLRESQRVGRIGSYILDIDKGIWAGSNVLDDIFGIEPFAQKDVESWNNLVHPDERQAMLDYFTYYVIGEKQSFDKEYRIVRVCDGQERWVWGHGELLMGPEDQPLRMIGTIQDITDRKLAEEQIKKLNSQLEQRVLERTTQLQAANKELEAFAYSVSHDLRAPLRGIDGWSLALLEDYGGHLDEQGRKYIARVRSETQRMGQLIDDLLQLSRLTRSEMQPAKVELSGIAQSLVERLKETNGDRLIEFIIQPDLAAWGDPHLLEIALHNLLNNACKFSSTRKQAIIEFGQTLQNGKLAFFVRDNGVGFDMIYAKKLFGAFQRMHKQSEFPGNGIGLATVQRIIHRHGGSIWAEASPDKGAVFYFTLEAA